MRKLKLPSPFVSLQNLGKECISFLAYLLFYARKKIITASIHFEKNKNRLVKFFLMKRGRYNRPFLHVTTMAVLGVGVLIAPYLADTYPIFSSRASTLATESAEKQSIIVDEDVFKTYVSRKPRDKIISYIVQKGDTISTIAKKFSSPDNQISEDTIRWANDLTNDNLSIGDELKILPVSGISHKVAKGDSVYTIAKKYDTEAQKIVDFPFNDFANPETFSLVAGQMLIVPDGIKPSERPTIKRQTYIAQGPTQVYASGFTWPVRGGVSQFATWYHMAIDITSDIGTPVVAGQNGRVVATSAGTWDGGYGTNLYIENGDGFKTHYAHLSGINMGVGQTVTAGKTVIGWVGTTGRSSGPHVHFEIIRNGVLVNPLTYLQ